MSMLGFLVHHQLVSRLLRTTTKMSRSRRLRPYYFEPTDLREKELVSKARVKFIWKRNPMNQRQDHCERAFFLQQLIEGLLQVQEEVHIPIRRSNRTYCQWKSCQPGVYTQRLPLQEVRNSATLSRTGSTQDYCESCMMCLCIKKGCWTAYHKAIGLPSRLEEDRRGGQREWVMLR